MVTEQDLNDAVYFYGGPFSNFVTSPFSINHPLTDGLATYQTVEHWFQANKTLDYHEHERIRNAGHPAQAKLLGRMTALRPDWEDVKYEVMVIGLRKKFEIPYFRQQLYETGTRYIAEDSPTDFIWGIRDEHGGYTGMNLLGQALMQVREELAFHGNLAN